MEDHITRYMNFVAVKVHHLVSLFAKGISQKDTRQGPRLKFITTLLGGRHIAQATKDPKMIIAGHFLIKNFKGRLVLKQ